MRRLSFFLLLFCLSGVVKAQAVDSIYFHLYTDSLKKGFYNYINVDGKTTDGKWLPLSAKEIDFVVAHPSLRFQDNDLFIDSSYHADTVMVKAVLKSNPTIWREVTIYIRKRGFTEPLKTAEEILREYSQPTKRKKS